MQCSSEIGSWWEKLQLPVFTEEITGSEANHDELSLTPRNVIQALADNQRQSMPVYTVSSLAFGRSYR